MHLLRPDSNDVSARVDNDYPTVRTAMYHKPMEHVSAHVFANRIRASAKLRICGVATAML